MMVDVETDMDPPQNADGQVTRPQSMPSTLNEVRRMGAPHRVQSALHLSALTCGAAIHRRFTGRLVWPRGRGRRSGTVLPTFPVEALLAYTVVPPENASVNRYREFTMTDNTATAVAKRSIWLRGLLIVL